MSDEVLHENNTDAGHLELPGAHLECKRLVKHRKCAFLDDVSALRLDEATLLQQAHFAVEVYKQEFAPERAYRPWSLAHCSLARLFALYKRQTSSGKLAIVKTMKHARLSNFIQKAAYSGVTSYEIFSDFVYKKHDNYIDCTVIHDMSTKGCQCSSMTSWFLLPADGELSVPKSLV